MPNYRVSVSAAPKGHELPPLLKDFGAWVGKQPHGSLGWFDALATEPIPKEWDPEHADRLRKNAFAFLSLPEGSLLALLKPEDKAPPAVVLLGSEGDRRTVANSLDELLVLWARGETNIDELDDEDGASGRKALAAWIKAQKVKTPKTKDFDFQAWLDGNAAAKAPAPKTAPAAKRAPTATMKKLGPKMRELASLMGRRADDPDVVAFVTKKLGKKLPSATSERNGEAHVEARKQGLELLFSQQIRHDAYPPIHKTAKSFVPYLSHAWIRERIEEPVLGVPWKATDEAAVIKVLGKPAGRRPQFMDETEEKEPYWEYELDSGAGVELEIDFTGSVGVIMCVRSALDLEEFVDVTTGLFVGWAATRGLLDESRFAAHADLFAKVKARKAKGSELVAAALPRGLWDDHLKDLPNLRRTAFQYFHNMNKLWITADLKKVFGKRPGPHGHDQPKVDDDTWDAVDKAAKSFDQRFAAWLKKR